MRVLICGGRNWADPGPIEAVLAGLAAREGRLTIIEGGAAGADRIGANWAKEMIRAVPGTPFEPRIDHETFHAQWKKYGSPRAAYIRNQQMLDEGNPDVVYAFKDNFDWALEYGGTEDMAHRAKKAGVPVYVVGRP